MDYKILLTSTLIATALSTLINAWFNLTIKKRDQAYDYVKYIIEKRKAPYDKVEALINELLSHRTKYDGSGRVHKFIIDYPDEPILFLNNLIMDIMKHSFWLSDEMFFHLNGFNYFLVELGKTYKDKPSLTLGLENFQAIITFTEKMCLIYFHDISKLDDMKSFKKKKIFY